MKIREGAALELPHILVLIDDPQQTVIEPLIAAKKGMEKLYEFDLMLGSGHLTGWAVARLKSAVIAALRNLARPERIRGKIRRRQGQAGDAVCNGRWESLSGHR